MRNEEGISFVTCGFRVASYALQENDEQIRWAVTMGCKPAWFSWRCVPYDDILAPPSCDLRAAPH